MEQWANDREFVLWLHATMSPDQFGSRVVAGVIADMHDAWQAARSAATARLAPVIEAANALRAFRFDGSDDELGALDALYDALRDAGEMREE